MAQKDKKTPQVNPEIEVPSGAVTLKPIPVPVVADNAAEREREVMDLTEEQINEKFVADMVAAGYSIISVKTYGHSGPAVIGNVDQFRSVTKVVLSQSVIDQTLVVHPVFKPQTLL